MSTQCLNERLLHQNQWDGFQFLATPRGPHMHNTAVEVYLHNASMRGFYTRTSGMGPNFRPPLGVQNVGRMRIKKYTAIELSTQCLNERLLHQNQWDGFQLLASPRGPHMHNTAVEVSTQCLNERLLHLLRYLHNASMRGFYTRTSGMGSNFWPPLGVPTCIIQLLRYIYTMPQ